MSGAISTGKQKADELSCLTSFERGTVNTDFRVVPNQIRQSSVSLKTAWSWLFVLLGYFVFLNFESPNNTAVIMFVCRHSASVKNNATHVCAAVNPWDDFYPLPNATPSTVTSSAHPAKICRLGQVHFGRHDTCRIQLINLLLNLNYLYFLF